MDLIEPIKKVGLIGGMSSQATGRYYELINQVYNQIAGDHNYPEIISYSVNFQNIENLLKEDAWEAGSKYLSEKAKLLEQSGADFVLMVSNTMHRVADSIQKNISIPFIHIADAVSEKLSDEFVKSIGVLGTLPVMKEEYYKEFYRSRGFEVHVPDELDQIEVDRIIFDELCKGKVLDSSKKKLQEICLKFVQQNTDGILLACTELEMAIQQEDLKQISLFDTMQIHASKAAMLALGRD